MCSRQLLNEQRDNVMNIDHITRVRTCIIDARSCAGATDQRSSIIPTLSSLIGVAAVRCHYPLSSKTTLQSA